MHDEELKITAETLLKKRQTEAEAKKKEDESNYDKNGRQLYKRTSKDNQKPDETSDGLENLHFVERWKKMNQMANNFENTKGPGLHLKRNQQKSRQVLSQAQDRCSYNRKLLAEKINADDYVFTAEEAFKVLNTKYLRLTKMNIDQMEKICRDEGIDVTQLHAHITDERNHAELMGSVFQAQRKMQDADARNLMSNMNIRRGSLRRKSWVNRLNGSVTSKMKIGKPKGSKHQVNEAKGSKKKDNDPTSNSPGDPGKAFLAIPSN